MIDIDQEFQHAMMRLTAGIDQRAKAAISRVYSMYTVGSGVCHCGNDINNHSEWDNHAPVEMMRDKGFYDDFV